jgi:hypothetical protein
VQLIERTQQMVLVRQPSLVLGDVGRAVAIAADPERITPFAAAPDVDGACRNSRAMLVETLHIFDRFPTFTLRWTDDTGAVQHRMSRKGLSAAAGTACPLRSDAPRRDADTTQRWSGGAMGAGCSISIARAAAAASEKVTQGARSGALVANEASPPHHRSAIAPGRDLLDEFSEKIVGGLAKHDHGRDDHNGAAESIGTHA